MSRRAVLQTSIIGVVTVAVLVGVFAAVSGAFSGDRGGSSPGADAPPVLADDTRILDDAGEGAVEVVEFLDFECEACGYMHPFVEDARERFAGEATFAYRYFPLPGHRNAEPAALAAEAAAMQGEGPAMYARLFETQAEWGERSEELPDRFRGEAADLGLDLDRYDEDIVSDEARERIAADVEVGLALGVSSTPTFFVDGVPVVLREAADLERAIERAVEARG